MGWCMYGLFNGPWLILAVGGLDHRSTREALLTALAVLLATVSYAVFVTAGSIAVYASSTHSMTYRYLVCDMAIYLVSLAVALVTIVEPPPSLLKPRFSQLALLDSIIITLAVLLMLVTGLVAMAPLQLAAMGMLHLTPPGAALAAMLNWAVGLAPRLTYPAQGSLRVNAIPLITHLALILPIGLVAGRRGGSPWRPMATVMWEALTIAAVSTATILAALALGVVSVRSLINLNPRGSPVESEGFVIVACNIALAAAAYYTWAWRARRPNPWPWIPAVYASSLAMTFTMDAAVSALAALHGYSITIGA